MEYFAYGANFQQYPAQKNLLVRDIARNDRTTGRTQFYRRRSYLEHVPTYQSQIFFYTSNSVGEVRYIMAHLEKPKKNNH